MIPKLWLNGNQLTGRASDSSPVLANCELDWGAPTDIEHQDAAQFKFQVLFRSGSQDIVGLQRGAEIELTYDNVTVFAGTVRSATAVSHKKGLLATVSCVEHLTDLAGMFTATEWVWSTAAVRWGVLRDLFTSKGWALTPTFLNHGYLEANTYYSSIKVLTLLERYIGVNGKLTRWDNSRRVDGELVKSVAVGYRGSSSSANRLATDGHRWTVQYWSDSNTGVITWLDGSNTLQSSWMLEPGTAINSAQISYQNTTTDPETAVTTTELVEAVRNDTASIAVNGVQSIEVTTSASSGDMPALLDAIAATWYRPDSGWTLEEATIYDTSTLTHERMLRLLDNSRRSQNLVIIRGVYGNTPNDTASNIRASLIGGTYAWDGEQWDMTLRLGRNQDFTAPNQWTFADIANSSNPAITGGTAESIGNEISFADFQQITKES